MIGRAARLLVLASLAGCAGTSPAVGPPAPARAKSSAEQDRAHVSDFAILEKAELEWLEAADPRIAMRAERTAPAEVVAKVGTIGVLTEDPDASIRGSSLDLFAFRARAAVLDHAARGVKAFAEALPETGPSGSALARPRLERELLGRLVEEEVARAEEEARIGDHAADLVRAIVSTWTPPAAPQGWLERDAWVSKRLLQIRDSLRSPAMGLEPTDLDAALYPLERLLVPAVFPKAAAAVAEVRMTLDGDMRVVPKLRGPEQLARDARTHLGVTLDMPQLSQRLKELLGRLRSLAAAALEASGGERGAVEARARELLMVERPCPAVPDSPVRSMAPPLERAAVCGALRALTEEDRPAAALVALHDDVLMSLAAVTAAPPPRTELLSRPANDVVDSLEGMARERPVMALGVALAAEIVYGGPSPEERIRAWRALGEAPLDVVARELDAHGSGAAGGLTAP